MVIKLKNKRLYKYYFEVIFDIVISLFIAFCIFIIAKYVLDYLYRYYSIEIVNLIWILWRKMKSSLLGNLLCIILSIVFFIGVYILVTYKKTKNLIRIIDETEEIVNGNLEKTIDINASGQIKYLVENINNIANEHKKLTLEERKAQQTKNDLITNVSHDLRTPLTSIIGYLEYIDNDKYRDEVQLRYYANIAYEKSKSLNLLINDLFELTKMQNQTIKLDKVDINLVELLGQVIAYFEYQFNKAEIKSRINFSDDKLIVNADAVKLVRVFENLLSNAIKYGKDGYYVDAVTKLQEGMAVVQIINYGQSISPIDLPFIFDRFYRVDKSRNSSIGGSGLGLAITKNIIELHKGTIQAFSDSEKTMFEVRLPLK